MTSVSSDRRQGVNASAAFKVPVLVATTGNITLSGLQTVDGVALEIDDRVLVKNQTSGVGNGIYRASNGDWPRDIDFDGSFDVKQGSLVFVYAGSTNSRKTFTQTAADPVVIGTTGMTFEQVLSGDLSLLTFIQGGAGAVSRSAQDKMREIVTPADFGAVGDLVTDDTVALAAAIATGLHVDLAGKGYLTQGLTLATVGQSVFNGKVKLKNATDQSVFTVTAHRCKVNEVEIDGNKANQTTLTDSLGSGVWIADGIDNVEVRDSYIHDAKRNGVAGFGNHDGCIVFGNRITGCALMGIFPAQASNRPCVRWLISANEISGFGQDGLGTVAIQHSTISGNRFLHPSDGVAISCVALEAECNHTAVFGNTFTGSASVGTPTSNGVQVNDSLSVAVTGNTFKGLGYGATIHGGSADSFNVTVSGNVFDDCGYSGTAILIDTDLNHDYRCAIVGNAINNSPYSAIHLAGASHCNVSHNMIYGVNLQNTASKRFVSGISLYLQSYFNTIIGNTILEGVGGNMKIGIHEGAPSQANDSGGNTIRDNRIVGADFDIVCGGTAYGHPSLSKVTRVSDTVVTAVPTTGHWERGQREENDLPSLGDALEWACTSSGTFSADTGTGAIGVASFTLTFNNAANAAKFHAGMKIRIAGAGVASADLDTYIVGFDGTSLSCTVKDAASTNVGAATISFVPPEFATLTLS